MNPTPKINLKKGGYRPAVLNDRLSKQRRLQKPVSEAALSALPPELREEVDPAMGGRPGLANAFDPSLLAAVAGDLRGNNRPPPIPTQTGPQRGRGYPDPPPRRGSVPASKPSAQCDSDDDELAQSKDDLLTMMVRKVSSLEVDNREMRGKLQAKEETIALLRQEISRHKLSETESSRLIEENAILQIQNTSLMQKLLQAKSRFRELGEELPFDDIDTASDSEGSPQDMEAPAERGTAFTVGGGSFNWAASHAPDAGEGAAEDAEATPIPKPPFDWGKLKRQVDQLNGQSGTQMEVVTVEGVKKFAEKKSVTMVFYADGVCCNDGPFRPYAWPAGQAIVVDLMDGYFPYEFKQQHPDGVPLNAIDKTSMLCPDPKYEAKKQVTQLGDLSDHGYRVISKNTFLDRIPKQVVKNGRVIPVRNQVGGLLGKEEQEANRVVVPVKDSDGAGSEEAKMTTLQVKCPGKEGAPDSVFIIQLYYHQTVGALRASVTEQLGGGCGAFQLCTAFPPKTFSDDSEALEAAGLVPNATLMVRW